MFRQIFLIAALLCAAPAFADSGSATLPATGNTVIATIKCDSVERIVFNFDVATQALDAFIISGRAHSSATYVVLYSSDTDYTTVVGILKGASGDLTAQAAATTGQFILHCQGFNQIQVEGSAAVNNAVVTWYSSGG